MPCISYLNKYNLTHVHVELTFQKMFISLAEFLDGVYPDFIQIPMMIS